MNKSCAKGSVTVKVSIQPGPVMPHMRACWKKWWAARIAECQAELEAEGEGNGEQ